MPTRFTAEEFETFKTEFLKWQERFGLTGYKVYFKHDALNDAFADITVGSRDCVATVRLSNNLTDKDADFANPLMHAKHEAFHLLVKRISSLAYSRHVTADEIYEAEEELVRKLEKLIA